MLGLRELFSNQIILIAIRDDASLGPNLDRHDFLAKFGVSENIIDFLLSDWI